MRAGSMWLLGLAALLSVGAVISLTVFALTSSRPQIELSDAEKQLVAVDSRLDEAVRVREFIKKKNIYLTEAEVNLLTMTFLDASRLHGVDLWLLLSVAASESHFRADVISKAGCIGIMQIKPSTARSMGIDSARLFEPKENIMVGARYLRLLLDRYGDDSLAVAAYNAGPSRVKTSVPAIRETRQYVQRVSSKRNELVALGESHSPAVVVD